MSMPSSVKKESEASGKLAAAEPGNPSAGNGGEEEGEHEICSFMEGGECKGMFIDWRNCLDAESGLEKCREVTAALYECMKAHADYYEPMRRAASILLGRSVERSGQRGRGRFCADEAKGSGPRIIVPFKEFFSPMNQSESVGAGMSPSESKTLEIESKVSQELIAADPTNPSIEDESVREQTREEEEEEEEEEGECGFCLFMKGGGCKESFIAWEKCVEDAENGKDDIVEKCFEVTAALKKCMEAHSDYYEPVLRAEKAAEEELEREVALKDSEQNKDDGNPAIQEKENDNAEEAVSKEN